MRKVKCSQCDKVFLENDDNPAIHYAYPAKICPHCLRLNELNTGDWYLDDDGNYKQKT